MLKTKLYLFYTLVFMLTFIATCAKAESWNALPIACLPERAQPWIVGKPETQQAACHCPPVESCPSTFEEYSDNSKAKMPIGFVLRCCPVVKAPEKCPNGQLKQDGVPCKEPEVAECPAKYYPNLNEAGIISSDVYTGRYTNYLGGTYSFSKLDGGGDTRSGRLERFLGLSIRISELKGWTFWCTSSMIRRLTAPECSNAGYAKINNGVDYSTLSLAQIVQKFRAEKLAWFGFSVAPIEGLPDNLANPAVTTAYLNKRASFVEIAREPWREDNGTGGVYMEVEAPKIGLRNAYPKFVEVCRSVSGEYVSIEHYNVKVGEQTLSCPYMQCRYVYDSTMESCLEESTDITLADGEKKQIRDLKVGDLVMNGEGKSSKIKAVNKYQQELRVLYGINGGKATFTGDHPIKTKAGWKVVMEDATKLMAKQEGFSDKPLAVGDVILGLDGKEIEVKSIERHANFDPINTYNLKIEGDNSFVAADMVVKGFNKMEMHY